MRLIHTYSQISINILNSCSEIPSIVVAACCCMCVCVIFCELSYRLRRHPSWNDWNDIPNVKFVSRLLTLNTSCSWKLLVASMIQARIGSSFPSSLNLLHWMKLRTMFLVRSLNVFAYSMSLTFTIIIPVDSSLASTF